MMRRLALSLAGIALWAGISAGVLTASHWRDGLGFTPLTHVGR